MEIRHIYLIFTILNAFTTLQIFTMDTEKQHQLIIERMKKNIHYDLSIAPNIKLVKSYTDEKDDSKNDDEKKDYEKKIDFFMNEIFNAVSKNCYGDKKDILSIYSNTILPTLLPINSDQLKKQSNFINNTNQKQLFNAKIYHMCSLVIDKTNLIETFGDSTDNKEIQTLNEELVSLQKKINSTKDNLLTLMSTSNKIDPYVIRNNYTSIISNRSKKYIKSFFDNEKNNLTKEDFNNLAKNLTDMILEELWPSDINNSNLEKKFENLKME